MAPTYTVSFARGAWKQLQRLPTAVQQRALKVIGRLAQDPRPQGCRKIKGRDNEWRIKVGKDYRVWYQVWDQQVLVIVIKVGPRQGFYNRK